MSELAVVSAKRMRLEKMALEAAPAPQGALELADDPSRFLSTVQVGITLIGIFNGAFGEASLVRACPGWLAASGVTESYAHSRSPSPSWWSALPSLRSCWASWFPSASRSCIRNSWPTIARPLRSCRA
jgi:hypothetical protein